jgi:hypothetical protein
MPEPWPNKGRRSLFKGVVSSENVPTKIDRKSVTPSKNIEINQIKYHILLPKWRIEIHIIANLFIFLLAPRMLHEFFTAIWESLLNL